MLAKEFFTIDSMLTLTGSVSVTFLICNGLQKAFDFNPKWLGLIVAIAISYLGVFTTSESPGWQGYVVGLVNGFLIFCTAAGATEIGNKSIDKRSIKKSKTYGGQVGGEKRGFLTSWLNG